MRKNRQKGATFMADRDLYDRTHKHCFGCDTTKLVSEFSIDRRADCGYQVYCKACNRVHANKSGAKAQKTALTRARRQTAGGIEQRRRNHLTYYAKNRMAIIARMKRDPDQEKARSAVYRAVKRGDIMKPEMCTECGQKRYLHGHHHKGYAKENRLDIIWLCIPCHQFGHERIRFFNMEVR